LYGSDKHLELTKFRVVCLPLKQQAPFRHYLIGRADYGGPLVVP